MSRDDFHARRRRLIRAMGHSESIFRDAGGKPSSRWAAVRALEESLDGPTPIGCHYLHARDDGRGENTGRRR